MRSHQNAKNVIKKALPIDAVEDTVAVVLLLLVHHVLEEVAVIE